MIYLSLSILKTKNNENFFIDFLSGTLTPQLCKYQKRNPLSRVAKDESDLKRALEEKEKKINLVKIGNTVPNGILWTANGQKINIKDFRNKLLIIDFWATWCSPCIKEIPQFFHLGNKYSGEKVEFITISINEDFNYWKKYLEEENWAGGNYWLGTKEDEPFFSFLYSKRIIDGKKNILIGLPKYVIIGPNGKILNNNAKKPSDPEFEKEIQNAIAGVLNELELNLLK